MKAKVVRARAHHGSRSLDLSIPVDFCLKHKIAPGDIFKVEAQAGGTFSLVYTRVRLQP